MDIIWITLGNIVGQPELFNNGDFQFFVIMWLICALLVKGWGESISQMIFKRGDRVGWIAAFVFAPLLMLFFFGFFAKKD